MSPEQFINWLERKSQLELKLNGNDAFEKPLVMGVLNVTSDSFFDGGKYSSVKRAGEHALRLIDQGADIIDVGGESTKPGALYVPVEAELKRVIPVIQYIRLHSNVCISIDTYKPKVMQEAVNAGANIINDVYALRHDGALAMAAQLSLPICLMHMQGQPRTMQDNPYYPEGVLVDLKTFFNERINTCINAGIDKKQLLLDPGFGFGKLVKDNLQMIYHLNTLKQFNIPLLLGVSRKSSIGVILNKEVDERLIGSISIAVYAALQGVNILRTHDVDETNQALKMINAICHA